MPHRLDHSSYATGAEDFAEYYPLGRTEFTVSLLSFYPDKPTVNAHQ